MFTGGLAWGSPVLWERLVGLAVALLFAWLAANAGWLLHPRVSIEKGVG
jgi:hypothetical protein